MRSLLLSTLRRTVLALVVAQLAMAAFVPLHDQVGSSDSGPTRIEAQHQHPSLPAHDGDSCPLCHLLSTPLLRPEAHRVALAPESQHRPAARSVELPAARGPPSAHQTRAPPSDLA